MDDSQNASIFHFRPGMRAGTSAGRIHFLFTISLVGFMKTSIDSLRASPVGYLQLGGIAESNYFSVGLSFHRDGIPTFYGSFDTRSMYRDFFGEMAIIVAVINCTGKAAWRPCKC